MYTPKMVRRRWHTLPLPLFFCIMTIVDLDINMRYQVRHDIQLWCRNVLEICPEFVAKLSSHKQKLTKHVILTFDPTLISPVTYLRKIKHALESSY